MIKRLAPVAFACLLLPVASPLAAQEQPDDAKPVIVINMWVTDREITSPSLSVSGAYADSVARAGGIPLIIPPMLDTTTMDFYADIADGFVFVGGRDINPARYGQEQHETVSLENVRREEFDLGMMRRALDAEKPLLAICLGMQELNLIKGGTLIQDIPSQTEVSEDHRPADTDIKYIAHDIEIEEGTLLHGLVGKTTLSVNSLHHQACDALGTGVLISARSPEGIIEAIELQDYPFAVGVQWHPEHLQADDETHLTLFRGLVAAAKGEEPLALSPGTASLPETAPHQ